MKEKDKSYIQTGKSYFLKPKNGTENIQPKKKIDGKQFLIEMQNNKEGMFGEYNNN